MMHSISEIERRRKLRAIFERTPTEILKLDLVNLPHHKGMIERELGKRV